MTASNHREPGGANGLFARLGLTALLNSPLTAAEPPCEQHSCESV